MGTSVGLASGIDTDSIVAQLIAVDSKPITRLQTKVKNAQTSLTYYTDLKSKLQTLQSTVTAMKTVAKFSKMSATSSDEDIATVSATGEAQAGTHTLKVTQKATNTISVSSGYSSKTATLGTGTIKVTVGDKTYSVEINSTNNTLSGIKDAINNIDTEDDEGITASIANSGDSTNPYRLVVSSDETGSDGAHTISFENWTGSQISFTNGADDSAGQTAQDAKIVFDGLNVTKSSNEIDDLISGMTIYLKDDSEPDTKLTIGVESDTSKVTESINSFVTAYNDIVDYIETKLDTSEMKSDYTFTQILNGLRNVISTGNQNTTGVYKSLSMVGVMSDDGKLEVDSDTLSDALDEHFDDVVALFATEGTTSNQYVTYTSSTTDTAAGTYAVNITGVGSNLAGTIGGYSAHKYASNYLIGNDGTPVKGLMIKFTGTTTGSYGTVTESVGMMEAFERKLSTYLNSSTGTIKTTTDNLNSKIDDWNDEIDTKQASLDKEEAALKAKFTLMEQTIQKLQTASSTLSSIFSS
jgi:flagellar hook-associated protein 2